MAEITLTEREAARLWARAYNAHDWSVLGPFLAADVRVMSRWVVNDLVGRTSYIEYLKRKFATFEQTGSVVRVEVGEAPSGPSGVPGRACALIEQDGSMLATVFFDVVGGRIAQISLGPYPPPEDCLRSGEFPGFEEDRDIVN